MKILIVGSLREPDTSNPDTSKPIDPYYDYKIDKNTKEEFRIACEAMGEAFTRQGFEIMVGVPTWELLNTGDTVTAHVVRGADRAPAMGDKKNRLIFYAPLGNKYEPKTTGKTQSTGESVSEDRELTILKNEVEQLEIIDKFVGSGESRYKTIPNVAEVDAVLLIAGREGTESIGYAAYSMEKPVIAVTSFGGAAEHMSKEVLFQEYNQFYKRGDLDGTDLRALEVKWDASNEKEITTKNAQKAEAIVKTTKKLAKAYGKTERQTSSVLNWVMILVSILLAFWVVVYLSTARTMVTSSGKTQATKESTSTVQATKTLSTAARTTNTPTSTAKTNVAPTSTLQAVVPPPSTAQTTIVPSSKTQATGKFTIRPFAPQAAFFLLLFTSALLGAGLRVLVSYQNNQIARLKFTPVFIDAVIALVIAFGFALIYLIGGISFTGEVVLLDSTTDEAYGRFTTVAIFMSLLGMAAGYLVPLKKLTERLENIVPDQNQ